MMHSRIPNNFEVHKEFSSDMRGDLQGNIGRNFRANRGEGEDRVVISNSTYGEVSTESEGKWEPIPQELLYGNRQEQYPQYTADPLDFLTPAEAADLPDLDFPVPDQNVIPEMVFENDDVQLSQVPSGRSSQTPQPQAARSAANGSSTRRASSNTHASTSVGLIPIQSSVVAHARSGKMSAAAVQERRAKNTEAARRSRARRADKITELRQEKEDLLVQNAKLVAENQRLMKLVKSLGEKLTLKSSS